MSASRIILSINICCAYNKEVQSTRCNNRRFIKIPKLARHVSGNSYAHLQEHYTVGYSLWYEAPYMLTAVGLDADGPVHLHPSQRKATYEVHHPISCILQSNAPEDGHNYCPKHVELTLEF